MFTVNLWDSKKDVDTETQNFERCLDRDYDDDVENKTSQDCWKVVETDTFSRVSLVII